MKKLAFLLVLTLLMPVIALAEQTSTVQFGCFTLLVTDNDIVQTAEKVNGQALAQIYPNYDPLAATTDNVFITWTSDVLTTNLGMTPQDFAEAVLSQTVSEFAAAGLTLLNSELLEAEQNPDNAVLAMRYILEVDYSSLLPDTVLVQYQALIYIPVPGDGTYVFALTSSSNEGLDALDSFLGERLIFPE